MKNINIHFDDKEYKSLILNKQKMTWHDFILFLNENHKSE